MGEAPPLQDSPWVGDPAERLIRIVLHGVRGRMEIAGQVYDREMPGFGNVLSDAQAAALVSHVRERFGRHKTAVGPDAVRAVRRTHAGRTAYWSVEELLETR